MRINEFLTKNCLDFKENIYLFNRDTVNKFNELYITLREKEYRIYDDVTTQNLPNYSEKNEFLAKEWALRKISSQKLKNYLSKDFPDSNILEIGCGSGWLCNYLSTGFNTIFGLDINYIELLQAARLFYKKNKIEFIFGDIFQNIFPEQSFNIIVFASSIQYFENLPNLMSSCKKFLTSKGEIHILDSHLYSADEVFSAKQRSSMYYDKLGIPEMKDFYFHHSINELDHFMYEFLYNPESKKNNLVHKLINKEKNPFPWIKVT